MTIVRREVHRYSLALKGDNRCQAQLIHRLDDAQPYNRWIAALALSRLLGRGSRQYLEHRAEDAGDDLERCALLAASIRAGDHTKANDLHQALQVPWALSRLRSVWKIEILDAFRTTTNFDPRAFDLWREATALSGRMIQHFDNISPVGTKDRWRRCCAVLPDEFAPYGNESICKL
jgi:hypothetical protein